MTTTLSIAQLEQKPPGTHGRRGSLALLVVAMAAILMMGCSGVTAPKTSADASGKRDTEMKHESCDLASKNVKTLDSNGDGRPEIITVMDGNRPLCRAVDFNLDAVFDVYIYYDSEGRQRRRESGFGRGPHPNEISHFKQGILVFAERETNNDTKIDTWDYYQGGRLLREERDSTGDGFVDQWWTFNDPARPTCAVVVNDNDGNGKPDPDSSIDLCKDRPGAPKPASKADSAKTGDADANPDMAKDGETKDDDDGPEE